MKRLALAVTGTVAGVTALLSFKTETHPIASAAALPSASLGSAAASPTLVTKSWVGSPITTRYGVVQVKVTRGVSRSPTSGSRSSPHSTDIPNRSTPTPDPSCCARP